VPVYTQQQIISSYTSSKITNGNAADNIHINILNINNAVGCANSFSQRTKLTRNAGSKSLMYSTT